MTERHRRPPTGRPPTPSGPSSRPTTSGASCPTRSTSSSPARPAARYVQVTGAADGRRRPRHAAQLAGPGRGVRRPARRAAGADVVDDRPGLDRPALLRLRPPRRRRARCSPRATTPRSTTASRCAARGAVPLGHGVRPRRHPRPRARAAAHHRAARRRGPAAIDLLDAYADAPARRWCRSAGRPAAQGRRRRRQRHGRPHRARGLRPAARAARSSWCRSTSSSTAPSRTTRPTRSSPPTCVDLQARVVAEGADIGLAFDGDADRCFLVDERGAAVSPSALTALIAGRELAKQPGATVIHNLITSRAVPELVRGARRRAGPHPGRALLHQGHDGRDRRDLRRRAQRPLLLPRLLARRLRDARRAARAGGARGDRPAALGAAGGVRALPAQRRDQLRGRRPAGRHRRRRRGVRRPRRRRPSTTSTGSRVSHADWPFNVRPSNTEPLLRLNAEGSDEATMDAGARRGAGADPQRHAHEGAAPDAARPLRPCSTIIVCPDCHGDLRRSRPTTGVELVCQVCGLAYPVRDDIPVLLVDEARRPG